MMTRDADWLWMGDFFLTQEKGKGECYKGAVQCISNIFACAKSCSLSLFFFFFLTTYSFQCREQEMMGAKLLKLSIGDFLRD